ncbi:hypothetical protein CLU79DRAFT_837881 [Phycomyces nitens]|nr:hypothetical protein CLU79DRAFT_837881 [Phycomyces nitens]
MTYIPKNTFETFILDNSSIIDIDDGAFFELLSHSIPDPVLWSSSWPSQLSLEPLYTKQRTKKSSNARLGYCQHPKHAYYRIHGLHPHPPSTPRRGRPPKGVASVPSQHIMTVRPLPKRLEQVVGESNIKVCLTCLKRSDLDQEYISNPLYIGPQQLKPINKQKDNV